MVGKRHCNRPGRIVLVAAYRDTGSIRSMWIRFPPPRMAIPRRTTTPCRTYRTCGPARLIRSRFGTESHSFNGSLPRLSRSRPRHPFWTPSQSDHLVTRFVYRVRIRPVLCGPYTHGLQRLRFAVFGSHH